MRASSTHDSSTKSDSRTKLNEDESGSITELTCNRVTNCCRAACIDVGELRADARRCFERVAIQLCYLDTAVITCLIADRRQVVDNPLGYCLAVGRRLQEESAAAADERQRAFERKVSATCSHGSAVDHCSECARDREFALELFPSLRRYVPTSLLPPRLQDELE